MKLLILLAEYWNADKWKCAPSPFKWDQTGPSKHKRCCPRFYAKSKGGAKVKNKDALVPYSRITVCEGGREADTHKDVPTTSEDIIATG
jgi:hypothetical protein